MATYNVKSALARIGGLSQPSKMPCYGYSLPASLCPIGAKLAKQAGTVCSGCYATKGAYAWSNTQRALRRRYDLVSEALRDESARADYIGAFSWLLNYRRAAWKPGRANDTRYFRWHDSGDIQNLDHFSLIVDICKATPGVRHWLPTRELPTVRRYMREIGPLPANLRVRASAARIDAPAPQVDGIGAGSAVHSVANQPPRGASECGAYLNDGECGDCRACWDDDTAVSYRKH